MIITGILESEVHVGCTCWLITPVRDRRWLGMLISSVLFTFRCFLLLFTFFLFYRIQVKWMLFTINKFYWNYYLINIILWDRNYKTKFVGLLYLRNCTLPQTKDGSHAYRINCQCIWDLANTEISCNKLIMNSINSVCTCYFNISIILYKRKKILLFTQCLQ